MASIHQTPKSKKFRLMFRYGGKQYQKSLKTTNPAEAEALKGKVELILLELERGRRTLPPDADIWQFLISDGQRSQKAEAPTVTTLEQLFSQYEAGMPPGAMEANSLATILIHRNHLVRILGGRTAVPSLTTTVAQGYINTRSREKYRGKLISSRTIKKEVTTLRSVWNWGKEHGLVNADAPTKGLRYEKEEDKPNFMAWEEIERQVARGGLSKGQVKVLWDALFLSTEQVAECLEYVRSVVAAPFVYPMFVFVAHTGARRSEVVRSRVEDIDFDANRTRIRERKKNKTKKETWRYVELSPLLKQVMGKWLREQHPGGQYTFCQTEVVGRSRTRSRTTGHQGGKNRATTTSGRKETVHERADRPGLGPLTKDVASSHFKQTLAGSRWSVVRGFHVFRHSFASNLERFRLMRSGVPGVADVVPTLVGCECLMDGAEEAFDRVDGA